MGFHVEWGFVQYVYTVVQGFCMHFRRGHARPAEVPSTPGAPEGRAHNTKCENGSQENLDAAAVGACPRRSTTGHEGLLSTVQDNAKAHITPIRAGGFGGALGLEGCHSGAAAFKGVLDR